ncbi:MAG: hypothetical protein KAR14_12705, partial [Candidatus Aminicenantes bacterium]|nr:hypothetical protein [Candidatus Aminicenantes bacterium]
MKKFLIVYLLFVLIFVIVLPSRMRLIKFTSIIIFAAALFFLLKLFANNSMFLNVFGFEISSVLMFLYFSILCYLVLTRAASKIRNEWLLEIISVTAMMISVSLTTILIRTVNFAYMSFSADPNYLIFILSMFILLSIPFRILDMAESFGRGYLILFFIFLNSLFIFFAVIFLGIPYIAPLILSLMLILNILYKKNLLLEVLRILMISIVLFLIIFSFSETEKKKFIAVSLKNIFSNQNNYAKFISRELIHNIHVRNENLSEYFMEDQDTELEMIWRRSIALKENISSGIYIISDNNKILSSFSYRIPYLNVATESMFPFWMIDEFKAEYFGRTISVAVASINIFEKSRYLGKIIVQVMNSSDLITRDHPD